MIHRTCAAIEAEAAELKTGRGYLATATQVEIEALRREWKAARAHDCEAWDGECVIVADARTASTGRYEFAPVDGHYDMG